MPADPPAHPPSPDAVAVLLDQVSPGARLVRAQRLRGGLSCRMDRLDILRADGARWKISLRRFVGHHRHATPEAAAYEFDVLKLLDSADVAAPRPLLLDQEGDFFGVPAIVMTYLPGRPRFPTDKIDRWTEGLARALHDVHRVRPDRFDLSRLTVAGADDIRDRIERKRDIWTSDPLGAEVHAVLESHLERIEFSSPVLVHDDYWPGNVIWCRGRVAGVIDWTSPVLGDRRADVSECRIGIVISHGLDAGNQFSAHYERLAGVGLRDLWYFDLLRGVNALLNYELWMQGYDDMDVLDVALSEVDARIRAFLRRALEQAPTRR
jgi:aminoglycoside phosphotransferase (APT) family kinase protein